MVELLSTGHSVRLGPVSHPWRVNMRTELFEFLFCDESSEQLDEKRNICLVVCCLLSFAFCYYFHFAIFSQPQKSQQQQQ